MPKTIILLSDGTGNSAAKLFKTNVWRLYQALDLSSDKQIARYNDGVGTSAFRPLALFGGIFGWGLKRNILDLYVFLCSSYSQGDRIYAFGFSRGAFTIRVLLQFVLSHGLVTDYHSQDDLRHKAVWLYRDFRKQRSTKFKLDQVARWIRDFVLWPFKPKEIQTFGVNAVAFVGLWDTVDAYGLPVEELKRGIDRYIWPLALEDPILSESIDRACHALSLDDCRKTFHPLLWDESDIAKYPLRDRTDAERLTQVFFAGAHANVGGGYPDDRLSSIPLLWMINEARKDGHLIFDDGAIAAIKSGATPLGRIYDSRSGFGAYYRYNPRLLAPCMDKQGAFIPYPKVHESVLIRMRTRMGIDQYAPLNLTPAVRIVCDLDPTPEPTTNGTSCAPNIHEFKQYVAEIANKPTANYAALKIETPSQQAVELIWDTVWWRRLVYFITLITTGILMLYPFASEHLPVVTSNVLLFFEYRHLTGLQSVAASAAGVLADGMSKALPSMADPWIKGFRSNPITMITLLTFVVLFLSWGRLVDRKISDRARAAWNTNWTDRRYSYLRSSLRWRFTVGIISLIATGLIAWGAVWQLHHLENLLPDNPDCIVEPCRWRIITAEAIRAAFKEQIFPALVPAGVLAVGIVSSVIVTLIILWMLSLIGLHRRAKDQRRELPGFALWLANRFRNSSLVRAIAHTWAHRFVPLVFAICLVILCLAAGNALMFSLLSGGGWICATKKYPLSAVKGELGTVRITDGCANTGLGLVKGRQYQIRISVEEELSDDVIVRAEAVALKWLSPHWWKVSKDIFSWPLRRRLFDGWFVAVIRVGEMGTDEYLARSDYKDTFVVPPQTGELFIFVNEPVVGIPGIWDIFYKNNKGALSFAVCEVGTEGCRYDNN